MRILKWVGLAVGGVVALCVVGLILVAIFFDPNDYKADLERLAEERLQRKLTLQGDLKLSVFPWLAVTFGPAQLGERAGFGSEPFVALNEARLSIRLLPLLQGRVEIGDVLLRKPSIRLLTDERGQSNWSDLTDGPEQQPSNTAPTNSVQASVASVHIEDGTVTLIDRQENSTQAVRDFDFDTGNIASGRSFDLKTAFVLEQDGQALPVSLSAQVTADFEAQKHTLDHVQLDSRWLSEAARAHKHEGLPLSVRIQSAALDLQAQTLTLNGLAIAAGSAKLSGALTGTDILDAPAFSGHIELAPVSPRQLMSEAGMTAPVTRDAGVLKQLSVRADIQATGTSVAMQQVNLKLDDTTATGDLAIIDLAATALRFNLNVDRIDFDRYLPPPAPESQAPANENAESNDGPPTPIPVAALRALNARGDLRIGDAKFAGMRLSRLHVGVNAREGEVRLAPTDASIYGGQYKGSMDINVAGSIPRLTVESHASGIDFKPLFKDMFETERVSGRGNANVKVTGLGKDTLAIQKTLAGSLDFAVADGAVEGTDLWYEIRRARALFKRETFPERAGPARTPFNSLKGTGTIQNGVLTNNDLDVATQVLKIAGRGTVDIVHSALDYALNVKVLRVTADPTASDLVDAEIPVKVTGSLSSPKVRPDIEGLAKARVKEEVEKQTEKVREKVQEKLQEKLQDIFRR